MHRVVLLLSLVTVPSRIESQQLSARTSERAKSSDEPARAAVMATRAPRAPVIDGRANDAIWRDAHEITGFRVYDPVEDGEPSMRTVAKLAYDDRNLYVLVRAFDPHPDSIVSLLSRRDVKTPSDQIKVVVDSYFDRRTGYEFAVNPVGVKRDFSISNDADEDDSWDGVWDVAARVDSLGWVAEFKIPLSQLRFPKRESHTFGVGIYRDIARLNERIGWPLLRRSKFGFSSQLGEISGIDGIATPRRLEILPYTVSKNSSERRITTTGDAFSRAQQTSIGADLKYGVASNLTLDATVNPDFGQVEADPAVLNLSATETYFGERRPFFLEGTGIFRFDMSCSDNVCNGLFYSRRIGRAPQLGGLAPEDASMPAAARILGAAKLTGRVRDGLSIGVLEAVTGQERTRDVVVEPQTEYAVARVQQDFDRGASGIGFMLTGVRRTLDDTSARYLRREGYTGGFDFRYRFWANRLQLAGYATGSIVRGSPESMALTQQSSVHAYQRPDDNLRYDSTRTSLTGSAVSIGLNKLGGDITRFWTGYTRTSPGFEINDVGFWTHGDDQSYSTWLALVFNKPHAFYRRLQVNFNQWNSFTTEWLRTGTGGNINANAQLANMWSVYGGAGVNASAYCTFCARGGPAVRSSPSLNSWAGISGDERRAIIPSVNLSAGRSDDGHSSWYAINPGVQARVSSRFSTSISPSFNRNIDDAQWLGNYGALGDDTTHYTVAHLDQKTLSLTTRVDFTATPTLSLQLYAQPFVTGGAYRDWRELNQPRALDYATRYRPFTVEGDPGGFNYKEFRSNTVVRWEYRPGSTLFFVWQQGRVQDGRDVGSFEASRDYRNLFRARPDNTLLIKASYWLSM